METKNSSGDYVQEVFWTRGYTDDIWRMRIYIVRGRDIIKCDDAAMTTKEGESLAINLMYCRLGYDGRNTMIVSDLPNNTVHTWNVDGSYGGVLLTADQVHKPCRPAVDRSTGVLYLGTWDKVGMYSLVYGDSTSTV